MSFQTRNTFVHLITIFLMKSERVWIQSCHGTLLNAHRRLTRKIRSCWIKSLFWFSSCTNCILVASYHYGWNTVTWTILMMSLLPFWALNVSVALLSTQGKKSQKFHQKYLKVLRVWETWGWVINDGILKENVKSIKAHILVELDPQLPHTAP